MWKRILAVNVFAVASAQRELKEPEVAVHNPEVSSWLRGEQPPADHSVSVTVVVRIDDDRRAALERLFWEVSDPKHANYGKYKSRDEITELLAVPLDRVERVGDYFSSHGMTSLTVSPNRDMISATGPVAAVEAALDTQLHFFTHAERRDVQIVRASRSYSLPTDLSRDVVMVGELLQFPGLRPKGLSGLLGGSGTWPDTCEASACSGLVTPAVLSARYRHPNATDNEEAVPGNSMSVAEFQGERFKAIDLNAFGSGCGVSNVAVDIVVGDSTEGSGVESELDIEYIKAVAPNVPLTVVYNQEYSLLDWANQITSLADSPLVHSVSYGNDERQQSSDAYMFSANTAFMKAGLQGLSILYASGDQGVCGREGCGYIRWRFKPDFPAASPYITAVGGTDFLGTEVGDEQAWRSGGGGFSDTFDIPSYQEEAVAAYKARADANLPPQRAWNNTGRGYPDVAALGGQKAPYCINAGGRFEGVAGTSASAPVVAGIFARLNGLRLAAGKPAMGFLNPFIYQNPSAFFDVKAGVNSDRRNYGFTAVEGWDASTGMGTPNYEALAVACMDSGAALVV